MIFNQFYEDYKKISYDDVNILYSDKNKLTLKLNQLNERYSINGVNREYINIPFLLQIIDDFQKRHCKNKYSNLYSCI